MLIFLELIWSFDPVHLEPSRVEMLILLGECGLVPIFLLHLFLLNNLPMKQLRSSHWLSVFWPLPTLALTSLLQSVALQLDPIYPRQTLKTNLQCVVLSSTKLSASSLDQQNCALSRNCDKWDKFPVHCSCNQRQCASLLPTLLCPNACSRGGVKLKHNAQRLSQVITQCLHP